MKEKEVSALCVTCNGLSRRVLVIERDRVREENNQLARIYYPDALYVGAGTLIDLVNMGEKYGLSPHIEAHVRLMAAFWTTALWGTSRGMRSTRKPRPC
jgi:hypothetical protein